MASTMTVISQGPIDVVESSLLPEGRLEKRATAGQMCARLKTLVDAGDGRSEAEANELIQIATTLQLKWNELDYKGEDRTTSETAEMSRIAGALRLVPEIIASNSGQIVEAEAAKAPVGSTGQLAIPTRKRRTRTTDAEPEKPAPFPLHIFLDIEEQRFEWVHTPAERDAKAVSVQTDPERFRMIEGRELSPVIGWK